MKDWTIMVYKAGDNNLSENMAFSLDEIASAMGHVPGVTRLGQTIQDGSLPTKDINLLVYFDGNSLTAPTQYIDYSDNKPLVEDDIGRYGHYPSQGQKEDSTKEGNSSSAYSILNFVRWCINTRGRTAKNYAVIFSGHSFGFHGTSFLRDESHGGYITLWRFRWALQTAVNDIFGKKIAILGFDSCVMSMLEVGFELKDVASTMIASEGSLPNSGWSYSALLNKFLPEFRSHISNSIKDAIESPEKMGRTLKRLNFDLGSLKVELESALSDTGFHKNENMDASMTTSIDIIEASLDKIVGSPEYVRETAKHFVTELVRRHNRLLIGGRSIDIAAWDLEKVKDVAERFNELALLMNQCFDVRDKIVENKLNDKDIAVFWELKKVLLQAHYDSQTYMNEQCVDLKDFCKRLIIESIYVSKYEELNTAFEEVITKSKAVIESIDRCVIHCGFSGDEYQYSNGISVFFPWSHLCLALTNYRYRYLKFSQGEIRVKGDQTRDLDNHSEYEGVGKQWYFFLVNYLNNVTLRQTRLSKILRTGENGGQTIDAERKVEFDILPAAIEDFTKSNPVWSRSNPIWSKSNPIWSRSNPDASRGDVTESRSIPTWGRSNPDASRSNPDASRSNPVWSKGEVGNYLFYFGRFKNFENCWDVSGFADQFAFEKDFDVQDTSEDVQDTSEETAKDEKSHQ